MADVKPCPEGGFDIFSLGSFVTDARGEAFYISATSLYTKLSDHIRKRISAEGLPEELVDIDNPNPLVPRGHRAQELSRMAKAVPEMGWDMIGKPKSLCPDLDCVEARHHALECCRLWMTRAVMNRWTPSRIRITATDEEKATFAL